MPVNESRPEPGRDWKPTYVKMDNKIFDVAPGMYKLIASLISSEESPVGIDAKKTHILILNKLQELSERMERLEQKLATNK